MLIHEGKYYAVRKAFGGAGAGPVVVTFPHAGGPTMGRKIAFGQSFLSSAGIDAYHLLNAEIDWFQKPEFWDAMAAIRADMPAGRALVTYGSSMGGYGALLASGRLNAARVFAVVPQFSIDRAVVPWERRWKAHAMRIGRFIHDVDAEIARDAQILSLHDPRNSDAAQLALFAPHPNWTQLRLPFSGHTPLVTLQQARNLSAFVTDVITGRLDLPGWRAKHLASRRITPAYWRILAMHALRLRRFHIAEYAIGQLRELGAHEEELRGAEAVLNRTRKNLASMKTLQQSAEEQRIARQRAAEETRKARQQAAEEARRQRLRAAHDAREARLAKFAKANKGTEQ